MNSEGGIVLIGVTNDGGIIGQEVTDKVKQSISNEISKLEPPSKIDISYISLENGVKSVIALQVKPGPHIPYAYDGRPYQREQTVTKRMTQPHYDQLVSQRLPLNFSWERVEATGYSIDDLDLELLRSIVRKALEVKRMPEDASYQDIPQMLEALELTIDGHINNAAVVLFGKKVMPNYPQCQLQLARFKGLDRDEFIDMDTPYGNVFELMEKAMTFVRRHLPIAAKIVPTQLERVETPLIPLDAIREVLYNAFCHRDYTIYGGSIGLAIYDDRMEIFSHGGLLTGVTLEKIKTGFSKRRNPVIAEVFYRAGLIEKWGRGIQQIISSCLAANDPEPEFFTDALEFKVIFRFPTSLKPPVWAINSKATEELSTRQKKIVDILVKGGELSTKAILEMLHQSMSLRTLQNELVFLESKGIIGVKGKTHQRVWFATKN